MRAGDDDLKFKPPDTDRPLYCDVIANARLRCVILGHAAEAELGLLVFTLMDGRRTTTQHTSSSALSASLTAVFLHTFNETCFPATPLHLREPTQCLEVLAVEHLRPLVVRLLYFPFLCRSGVHIPDIHFVLL